MSNARKAHESIKVVFRYANAKGLFVNVPGSVPGGAPIQMYTLATELAKDFDFNVNFWVDGEVPEGRIQGVKLISQQGPVEKGLPLVSRSINKKRQESIASEFAGACFVFSVAEQDFFPRQQEIIHAHGGKTVYRVASDIDVSPQLRSSDGSDAFSLALSKADAIITQTPKQQEELKRNFNRDSYSLKPSFLLSEDSDWSEEIILWVGQGWSIKRPWIVLELARRFPKEKFVMIMPAADMSLIGAIKDEAEKVENIEIVDYVEFTNIQRYFNRAKLVLNTSVHEGFPNTIHQAAMGKAPYISLSWDANNYLEKNCIGACAHNDVNRMVSVMSEYLMDPTFMHLTGERAYSNFKENHDVAVVIEDFKTAIRNVAMLES